jgi:hypothetical protein
MDASMTLGTHDSIAIPRKPLGQVTRLVRAQRCAIRIRPLHRADVAATE